MGLRDLFKGKPAEVKVERIELEQLPVWLARHRKELESGLDELAAPVAKKIPEIIKSLNAALDDLEKAEMKNDVQQRIKSIVLSSRDNYVTKARKTIATVDTKKNALELNESLGKALSEMTAVDMRYGDRARFGFEHQISAVRKWLTELAASSEGINCAAGERKEKLMLINEAEGILKQIHGKEEEIRGLAAREKEASEAAKVDKKGINATETKIREMENSANAKRLSAIKTELEQLRAKKQEIESQILNMLGPLKRTFKKYAKAVEEGKASGFSVDKYSEDPTGTYLRGDNMLPELLAKMQKAIQSRVISLDGGEDEKVVRKIRSITFAYLEKSRDAHREITARIRHLEVEAAELDVSKDIEKLQREESGLKEKAESESKSAAKIDADIEEKKGDISELNKKLAQKLSEFIKGRCELVAPSQ